MILPSQVFVGGRPCKHEMQPVRNRSDFHWKPSGGLWTSSLRDGTSDWIEWCREGDFALDRLEQGAWVLKPAIARVVVVATLDDLDGLLRQYRRRDVPSHSLLRSLARELLDYEALAREWDALHVPFPETFRLDSLWFNVMDTECTLWLRWNFFGEPIPLGADKSADNGPVSSTTDSAEVSQTA